MTNNFHKVAVLRTEWEIPEYYDNLSISRRSAFGIYWWVVERNRKQVKVIVIKFWTENFHRKFLLKIISRLISTSFDFHSSIAHDRTTKASVEIKRWNLAGNLENSKKAFLEMKMLKVGERMNCFRANLIVRLFVVAAFNPQQHRETT